MPFWKDALERLVKTYIESFVGLLLATNVFSASGVVDLGALQSAAIAAIPAVLSVVLSLVSKPIGNTNTASLVPAPVTPVTPSPAPNPFPPVPNP